MAAERGRDGRARVVAREMQEKKGRRVWSSAGRRHAVSVPKSRARAASGWKATARSAGRRDRMNGAMRRW